MSVYKPVIEKLDLTVNNFAAEMLAYTYAYRLSQLLARTTLGTAKIFTCSITEDDTTYDLTTEDSLETWKHALEDFSSHEKLSVVLDCDFKVIISPEDDDPLDTSFTESCFHETDDLAGYDDSVDLKDNVFFQRWENADCSDDNGSHYVYGTKDGKFYDGCPALVKRAVFPRGEWYEDMTSTFLEAVDEEEMQEARPLLPLCEKLSVYGKDIGFFVDENGISFYLDNLTLTAENIDAFAKDLAAFIQQLGEESRDLELHSLDPENPALMTLTVNASGSWEVSTTEI